MNRAKKRQDSVTHRSKGNTNPDPEADNLADEPEMKALSRMIDAGEVNPDRTLDYLKVKTETDLKKKSDGGGGGREFKGDPWVLMDLASHKILQMRASS